MRSDAAIEFLENRCSLSFQLTLGERLGSLMITQSELSDAIREFEADFPVNEWSSDGFRVWPLIRGRISWICQIGLSSGHPPKSRLASAYAALCRAVKGVREERRAFSLHPSGFLSASLVESAQVVLLSDGVSCVELDGRSYDRFCDPIEEHYRNRGVPSLKLLPAVLRCPPHFPSAPIGYELARRRAIALLHNAMRPIAKEPEGFGRLARAVMRRWGFSLSWQQFARQSLLVRHYAEFFQSIFAQCQTRVGFVVSYYGIEGYAFCLACRRAGIPAIDIQHGIQGPLHSAYGNWNVIPEGGYEVLPSRFLVWGEQEAESIQNWAGDGRLAHRPIVSGNLFLSQCQAGRQSAIVAGTNALRRLSNSGATQALWTLSYTDTPEQVLRRFKAFRDERQSIPMQWWIRLHPCGLSRLAEFRRAFQTVGIPGPQVDLATNLPLYSVLPAIDVHLTDASSTVVEAKSFGVSSVVSHIWGAELFSDMIDSGDVIHASVPSQILPALVRQARRRHENFLLQDEAKVRNSLGFRQLDRIIEEHGGVRSLRRAS